MTGFYDTPFITWLLKTQEKYNSKVFFEDQLGINRHWLGMNWGAEDVDTMITHYAGEYCALFARSSGSAPKKTCFLVVQLPRIVCDHNDKARVSHCIIVNLIRLQGCQDYSLTCSPSSYTSGAS